MSEMFAKILKAIGAMLMNLGENPEVPDSALNQILQDPARSGRELLKFLRNGARLIIGEPKAVKIDPSNKFNPTKFIGEGWTIWKGAKDGDGLKDKEEIDERSLALTEVDLSKVILETCLKQDESSIVGEEKLTRFKAIANTIRLGGNVFLALWEDYQANKENSCLEWLRKNRGVTYVDFFGLVLRNPRGRRYVLYLCFGGSEWHWSYDWLGRGWSAKSVSVGVTG